MYDALVHMAFKPNGLIWQESCHISVVLPQEVFIVYFTNVMHPYLFPM
jgi:hypothetical protein